MSEQTGAERYFAERMRNPTYAAAYEAAREAEDFTAHYPPRAQLEDAIGRIFDRGEPVTAAAISRQFFDDFPGVGLGEDVAAALCKHFGITLDA